MQLVVLCSQIIAKKSQKWSIDMKEKLKSLREKYLPYDEVSLRRLALATNFMFSWMIVWALVFKLGNEV